MPIPLELVDKYGSTFLDFWRLRPRRFLAAIKKEPKKYLSPMQFLAISLAITFSLGVTAIALSLTAVQSVSGNEQIGDPKALSARLIVFIFTMLVVGSLMYRATSFFWPIRGHASFHQIFEFQCYWMAIVLPFGAIDVLILPLVTELIARELVPPWVGALPFLLGSAFGMVGWFLYGMPGIAYLNRVSTVRQFMGTLFWTFIPGFIVGVVYGIIVEMNS